MIMKQLILSVFLFIILITTPVCRCQDQDLRQRVEELETQMGGLQATVVKMLEEELVEKYGMIRRCTMPRVEHGVVKCKVKDSRGYGYGSKTTEDLVPGSFCSVVCAPGYVASGGEPILLKDADEGKPDSQFKWITCEKGGLSWTGDLRCTKEIPLIVVSGGSDSPSVEVVSFHNSSGCHLNIPDIPKSEHGEVRLMHNMFYLPGNPFQLLVCNGLSQSSKASCDSWKMGDPDWKFHSHPHQDRMQYYNDNKKDERGGFGSFDRDMYDLFRSGRYGASSFTFKGQHYIAGGMLNKGSDHKSTEGMRRFIGASGYKQIWEKLSGMKTKRALFCATQYNATSVVAVGGHSGKLEKSVEILDLSHLGDKGSGEIPDMSTARDGHACVGIEGEASRILVAGGSDTTHRSGAKALKTAEMFSADTKQWERVGDMAHARFGHVMVNVGGRIIAFGGKEWNPDVPLKNAEEFDVSTGTWRSLGDVLSIPRANFGYVLIPHTAIPGCTVQ